MFVSDVGYLLLMALVDQTERGDQPSRELSRIETICRVATGQSREA